MRSQRCSRRRTNAPDFRAYSFFSYGHRAPLQRGTTPLDQCDQYGVRTDALSGVRHDATHGREIVILAENFGQQTGARPASLHVQQLELIAQILDAFAPLVHRRICRPVTSIAHRLFAAFVRRAHASLDGVPVAVAQRPRLRALPDMAAACRNRRHDVGASNRSGARNHPAPHEFAPKVCNALGVDARPSIRSCKSSRRSINALASRTSDKGFAASRTAMFSRSNTLRPSSPRTSRSVARTFLNCLRASCTSASLVPVPSPSAVMALSRHSRTMRRSP